MLCLLSSPRPPASGPLAIHSSICSSSQLPQYQLVPHRPPAQEGGQERSPQPCLHQQSDHAMDGDANRYAAQKCPAAPSGSDKFLPKPPCRPRRPCRPHLPLRICADLVAESCGWRGVNHDATVLQCNNQAGRAMTKHEYARPWTVCSMSCRHWRESLVPIHWNPSIPRPSPKTVPGAYEEAATKLYT